MKAHESEDAVAPDMGTLDGGEPAPMPAPGEQMESTPPLPWTPEHVPCLRDCRHYFHSVGHFDAGNAGRRFAQSFHACKALPGVFLELSADAPSYECTDWDPFKVGELRPMLARRASWFANHPDVPARSLEERLKDGLEVDVDEADDDETSNATC